MAEIRSSALSYLREEKVRVLDAVTPEGALRPVMVRALVQGHNRRYEVTFLDQGGTEVWTCTCGKPMVCRHAAAVALVIGRHSPATKQTTAA